MYFCFSGHGLSGLIGEHLEIPLRGRRKRGRCLRAHVPGFYRADRRPDHDGGSHSWASWAHQPNPRGGKNRTRRRRFTVLETDWLEWCSGRLPDRSEEHTSELQSRGHLVCRLLLEKKK